MQFRTRFTLVAGLVAGVVMMAMLVAGGAAASRTATVINFTGDNTDPQTTNIPYLAWAGEQIRLVKCFPVMDETGHPIDMTGLSAQITVTSWSGDLGPNTSPRPEVETGTQSFVADVAGGRICARGDVTSQYPGVAQIKLVVTDSTGAIVQPKHDFLAIWMTLSAPTLTEVNAVGAGDHGATAATNTFDLGTVAGRAPGILGVSVTGSFVWNGRTWTLPNDWAALAAAFAVDNDNPANPGPNEGAGPTMRWDIHDDTALTEGHPAVTGCTTDVIVTAIEAVDNCNGGGPFNEVFSRFFGINTATGARLGDTAGSGTGPFDPTNPSTLLSDGKLDQYDAPMPAAPIYLTLSGNVGALGSASKVALDSRDGTGANTAHNLYAPYYQEWIPSTSRSDIASGVDGPAAGNNFPGFQNDQGVPYQFWTAIPEVTRSGLNACHAADGSNIATPTGPSEIVVYTDEHGQAMAEFLPTAGFGLTVTANNLCPTFAGVAGTNTFTATVQAEAKYPFQPVFGQPQLLSGTLTKTVNTAASKVLSCVPKGTNSAFCVETITDLFGNPVSGAPVMFTANSIGNANLQPDATAFGGFDTTGQTGASVTNNEQAVTVTTGRNGQVGVLLTDSLAADCVNLRAENLGTRFNGNPGISVFTDFNPATGAACTAGPTGPNTGATGTPAFQPPVGTDNTTVKVTNTVSTPNNTNNNTSNNTSPNGGTAGITQNAPAGATAALDGKPTVISATAKPTITISSAKLLTIGNGRYLGLNLKSTLKVAKVNITLVGANGKVLGHVIKTVKTGKLVRVMKLGANVRSVRVSAITA